jgi:8-oxo-dGTP pyrophosphatase MutT (NUDIX family)
MPVPILSRMRSRPVLLEGGTLATEAVKVARDPKLLAELPAGAKGQVEQVIKAIQVGSGYVAPTLPQRKAPRPQSAAVVAARAHQLLGPSTSVTPVDIAQALVAQGLDWVEPFAPGTPLTPFYGYGRRPRTYDYTIGRNVTTETRPDRIPFSTLDQLYKGYDVAQICTRHAINGLRSMRVRFEAMDGYEENPVKEIAEVKKRLRRPDGKRFFKNWLAQNMLNLWRYDSAPIYRLRDNAGNVKALKNITAKTMAVMLDYYGDFPESPAPAFQQFIEGVPWDWLTWDDVIYEPFWPETESPYGTPPLETVLINANTDVRLQLYFLSFFTAGQVPEAFAVAPEHMTSPDDLADFQEQYNSETDGDLAKRYGLKWLPSGTELIFYKPQTFDPELAEYVMRRTVSAFLQTPHNLGFTDSVNRASGDTQMDVQFRVDDLPTCGYYEDLLDSVIQDDWNLPVQLRFDTGGDKEDRVQEAQAHQIYVQMGAESLDEVREKVLGYAVNPEEKMPRFVDSVRLGPIPLAHILAISGQTDPLTGAPEPGTVQPIPYELPGGATPVPAAGPAGAPQGGGAGPKAPDPTKAYPSSQPRPSAVANKGLSNDGVLDEEPPEETPYPTDEPVGYGFMSGGSNGQGTGVKAAEKADLARWRTQSRTRVAKGKAPREFVGSGITGPTYQRVWRSLAPASTRAEVDAAFAKAHSPDAAGIVVQALDTGRVLMVQRTPDTHDPGEAYARWEFPGGHLTGDDAWTGALREWGEETGATLPQGTEHAGNWTSPDGVYVGYVVTVPSEATLSLKPTGHEVADVGWRSKEDLDAPDVRDKVTETLTRVAPLLKGWTTQARDRRGRFSSHPHVRWEQFHRHTDRIVAHYAPLIQKAFAKHMTRAAAHKAVQRAYTTQVPPKAPTAPLTPSAAAAAAASGALAPLGLAAVGGVVAATGAAAIVASLQGAVVVGAAAGLVGVVSALYADAYLQGAHEASEAANGSMPPWAGALSLPENYWEDWTPGVARAAQSLAGTGLAQLLADAGVVIKGVDHTQLERIGNAIAEGLDAGTPMATVIAEVDKIIDTPTRAKMIAETEYMRATGRAQMDTYQRNGVPELQWLHEPGACAMCMENVAASPQPARNPQWPQGPIPVHPWTRCVVAPYYGSTTGRKP